MAERLPQFPIRIDPALVKKMRYIAAYNGRSANKEFEMVARHYVAAFEKKHGEINLDISLDVKDE